MKRVAPYGPMLCVTILTAAAARGGPATKKEAEVNATTADVSFVASCDGSEQRYVRVLPAEFNAKAAHDVLIVLHGHGSDRWQFVRDRRAECRAARDAAAKHNMIYISPDYRASTSWMGPKAEADMLDIIREVRNQYTVERVFLCGGSMGGASALTFAALHPDLLAGVIAMNGLANHVEYQNFQNPIAESFGGTKEEVPEEYRRRSSELHAENLTMPLGLTVGGRDTAVPPASVLRLAEAVHKTNPNVLLIHREDVGHSTGYADATEVLEFVFKHGASGRVPQSSSNLRKMHKRSFK